MNKVFKLLILLTFVFAIIIPTAQAQEPVDIYFFYAIGCPHCEEESLFLEKLIEENPEINIQSFEVSRNSDNVALLKQAGKKMSQNVSGVPFTVIGENSISGYLNDETTGTQIERYVEICLSSPASCPDVVGGIIEENLLEQPGNNQTKATPDQLPETINLPIFGDIEVKNVSLPILTVMIGALDGFNPCAMWVLLFLISLLLNMDDRFRMWVLGVVFIFASGAVYFLFMVAWLNILLFLGFIIWIRILIALAALASGAYNLKEFWKNKDASCKVTKPEKRQRIFAKLKNITKNRNFLVALVGIALLAGAVNLVELVCSAGFPAVYTHILSLSNLSGLQYYFYISLYIFIFMLDDMLVFVIAMVTLKATGITAKYTRASYLIGGILMLLLGLMLIFKPEWLMFG